MAFDRLTWIGLMVVALGWALLVSGASALELFARIAGPAVHTHTFDFAVIAQATILTGFGLAILGALQTGFGALKKFFDAVLERSARGAPKPVAEPSLAGLPTRVVDRGVFKDRPYVLFGDGTIEIETLLGLRRFASLQEAHEFIG